jgi:hypothetical protein
MVRRFRASAPGWLAAGLAATAIMGCASASSALGSSQSAARPAKASNAVPGGIPDCVASPHVCGYPDATNTGVPASVSLLSVPSQVSSGPGWTYVPGGWVEVFGDGANLSDLYIPYNLDISASNVTIDDVEVVTTGTGDFGISLRNTSNVTIENSDIYSPDNTGPNRLEYGIKDIYGDSSGTVINGNNIWNTATGIAISEGIVENNYIHDFGYADGDHDNGVASKAGDPAGLTITHNTILNSLDQTDDIQLTQDFGPQMNATITDNLLAGGAYSIYGGASGLLTPSNIVITGNRFAPLYYANGGYYGPAAYVAIGPTAFWSGDVWRRNIWDNTLLPVRLGFSWGPPSAGASAGDWLGARGWGRSAHCLGFRRTVGPRWRRAPGDGHCAVLLCPHSLDRSATLASHQEQ